MLQDAYETLADPRLREDYDRMLRKKARVQRARVARHVVRKGRERGIERGRVAESGSARAHTPPSQGHAYQGLSEIAQFSWKQTAQRVSWPVFFFILLVVL